MNTTFEKKKAKGLGWGYAKIISERVRKNHKIQCSESMVYDCMRRKTNPYIVLEIELYKAEIAQIEMKIRAIQQTAS